MLLKFSVGNYLSFKDVVEFRMAAGKPTRHDSHIAVLRGGKRVLKGGFIFGANASGKSNLVRAFEFAKNIVLIGSNSGDCYKKYFRIDSAYKDKPGIFQFDIYAGGHFYSYGFAVSYQSAEIDSEWFYRIDNNDECIFERARDESGKMKVINKIQFADEKEASRFAVYSEDIDNDAMKRKTFLSDMAARSSLQAECYKPFRDVISWFNNLIIIYPKTKFAGINAFICDNEKRFSLERHLKYFDTGIEAVSRTEKSLDKVFGDFPEDFKASLKEDILRGLSESDIEGKEICSRVGFRGELYDIILRNDELIFNDIVSSHGNSEDMFDLVDESDGTRRLFDLLPLYHKALSGCVIIIDELDRSLHTKATVEFIKRFYEEAKDCEAQLIATTHDSNVLDLDILRQDEIWLVERMNNHASSIKSLNAYSPRHDKDIEKDYLIGRYGAVPVFNHLALLDDEDGECIG